MARASAGPARPSEGLARPPVRQGERLFIALWPDADTRAQLVRASESLGIGGRLVAPANLHMTMVFLGQVPVAARRAILKAMRESRVGSFKLVLDRSGHFSASRVAWLGCSTPPPQMLAIQQRLTEQLRGAGFALEERAFRAHVTLARDVGAPPATTADECLPITWGVDSLALVRSPARGGAPYQVLDTVGR